MSVTLDNAAQRAAYWPFAIVRAIPAVVLAVVITFSSNHSATFGLVTFGGFAVVSGILVGLMAWFRLAGSRVRSFFIAQGAITLAAGIFALVTYRNGAPYLFFALTAFAVITGFLELYIGIRTRRRHVASTDWITVGILTVIVALAFLLIPPGYSQTFHDPDGVDRVLDAGVVAVGFLGGYAAIIAVYLLIAGFSAKFGPTKAAPAIEAEHSTEADPTTKGGSAA